MPSMGTLKVIKEMRRSILFSNADIKALLVIEAQKISDMEGASFEVQFDDQTEGSPPYKVGVKARVDLTMKID